ncbi:uncharacterized protein LOC131844258 [Achroia grisella]|uniref:uncharacterized protein LOC131844258 n=1 Tax=Achroia grisella TaxID=688607 RepID=UPI0027D28C7B|nr:uncharacterized protein LOC131844258 [Achroia grisella]
MAGFTFENPAVQSYAFYSGVLALKTLGMALLTGRIRFRKKVFANEEDAKLRKSVVKYDDPDVERVRRAHLNDLENIPAFWLVGGLYLTTAPDAALAVNLFRVYTVGRILHTIVYAIKPLPQPARGISFGIPYLITVYMGLKVVLHYASALSYAFYSGVLALKTLGVAILTGRTRYRKKVFANEEDTKSTKGIVKLDDPDVERVRRAHLNDLENIPAFWLIGGLYLTTAPDTALAVNLFRAYTVGRILHTIVYAVKPLPQPARGISFGIPYLIMIYMGVKVVLFYASAL